MDGGLQKNHGSMVTFGDIPHTVVSEMAKHLDTYGDANWAALAELHGLPVVHINVRHCAS